MNRRAIAFSMLMIAATVLGGPIVPGGPASARAAEEFPYDRVLLLDVAPMRPLKRVPFLTVSENGIATIELWCRTAKARVHVSDNAIRIETAPLSEALPQYMSAGQCSEDRLQADSRTLEALTQATEWRKRGDGLELSGPAMPASMQFRASSH